MSALSGPELSGQGPVKKSWLVNDNNAVDNNAVPPTVSTGKTEKSPLLNRLPSGKESSDSKPLNGRSQTPTDVEIEEGFSSIQRGMEGLESTQKDKEDPKELQSIQADTDYVKKTEFIASIIRDVVADAVLNGGADAAVGVTGIYQDVMKKLEMDKSLLSKEIVEKMGSVVDGIKLGADTLSVVTGTVSLFIKVSILMDVLKEIQKIRRDGKVGDIPLSDLSDLQRANLDEAEKKINFELDQLDTEAVMLGMKSVRTVFQSASYFLSFMDKVPNSAFSAVVAPATTAVSHTLKGLDVVVGGVLFYYAHKKLELHSEWSSAFNKEVQSLNVNKIEERETKLQDLRSQFTTPSSKSGIIEAISERKGGDLKTILNKTLPEDFKGCVEKELGISITDDEADKLLKQRKDFGDSLKDFVLEKFYNNLGEDEKTLLDKTRDKTDLLTTYLDKNMYLHDFKKSVQKELGISITEDEAIDLQKLLEQRRDFLKNTDLLNVYLDNNKGRVDFIDSVERTLGISLPLDEAEYLFKLSDDFRVALKDAVRAKIKNLDETSLFNIYIDISRAPIYENVEKFKSLVQKRNARKEELLADFQVRLSDDPSFKQKVREKIIAVKKDDFEYFLNQWRTLENSPEVITALKNEIKKILGTEKDITDAQFNMLLMYPQQNLERTEFITKHIGDSVKNLDDTSLLNHYVDYHAVLDSTIKNSLSQMVQKKHEIDAKFLKMQKIVTGTNFTAATVVFAIVLALLIVGIVATPIGAAALIVVILGVGTTVLALGLSGAGFIQSLKERPEVSRALVKGQYLFLKYFQVREALSIQKERIGRYLNVKGIKVKVEGLPEVKDIRGADVGKADETLEKVQLQSEVWKKRADELSQRLEKIEWKDFADQADLQDPAVFDTLKTFNELLTTCDLELLSPETRNLMEKQLGINIDILQDKIGKDPEAVRKLLKEFFVMDEGAFVNFIKTQQYMREPKLLTS